MTHKYILCIIYQLLLYIVIYNINILIKYKYNNTSYKFILLNSNI